MEMEFEKYKREKAGKVNASYTVPLDVETVQDLKKLNEVVNVRAWARDLIRENLPSLKSALAKSGGK